MKSVLALLATALLASPALSYEIKPKTPETAFSGKLQPDIIGLSSHVDGSKAGSILESHLKDHPGVKPQAIQQKFGSTNVTYATTMSFQQKASATQGEETLTAAFSTPASGNFAYYIARDLGFAKDKQPTKSNMIERVISKYGAPTVIGDGQIYYFYRAGKIISVKQKYTPASALEALNGPINPKAAVALNDRNGRGSCIAALKHVQAVADKSFAPLLADAKAANCDGLVAVDLKTGASADKVGQANFTLVDFKRIVSAAKIDSDALAAEKAGSNRTASDNAPKL
jgi:hypothetical protein